MQRLPATHLATVSQYKVTHYLFSQTHPEGASKAEFLQRFGFTITDWTVLRASLIRHAAEAEIIGRPSSPYGAKYEVEGPLHSPDGRHPRVITVWLIHTGELAPRFITLNPSKRRLQKDD